ANGRNGEWRIWNSEQLFIRYSPFALFRPRSDFIVHMRVFATPLHRRPLRMLADPLRNVGRRCHGALLRRKVRRKAQAPLLAFIRREHGAHRDNQAYRIHSPISPDAIVPSIAQSYETILRGVSPGETP